MGSILTELASSKTLGKQPRRDAGLLDCLQIKESRQVLIIARVQDASVSKRAYLMASWFARLNQPQAQLGPPWAVPEAQLFDDDEDPAARLLRRRVRWEVVDEARNARLAGQEAFLSLAVLRLSTSDGGVGARIPLTSIHREEYMQPIFGANYLTGLARQDGATVRWTLEFLSAGAAQFASVVGLIWNSRLPPPAARPK